MYLFMNIFSLFTASAEQKQQTATSNMVHRKHLMNCTYPKEGIKSRTVEIEVLYTLIRQLLVRQAKGLQSKLNPGQDKESEY